MAISYEFKELRCPHCSGELEQGHTTVSDDVQMVKKCINCDHEFWMIIVIPNDDYAYSVNRTLNEDNS